MLTNENLKKEVFMKRIIVTLVMIGAVMFPHASSEGAGLLKPIHGGSSVKIKSHDVAVTINNGFARTEVDQVFTNSEDIDLEAVYSFPLPKRASLSEVSLWIDGREVIGEVLEKEKARTLYEEQKSRGSNTALAEKDEYKTFTIRVSPVRAQQDTRVRIVYYQPLEIELNVGRYVYPLEEGGVDDERMAFWSVDDEVTGTFSFQLELKSAFPVQDVRMPHYEQNATIENTCTDSESKGSTYKAELTYGEGAHLVKDIVFYYRLDDSIPARVEMIPFRDNPKENGTFMAVITPAASIERIKEGTDWVFVLDKSGSMSGEKIKTLCDGVARVIGKMSVNDRFKVITFSDNARDFTNGYVNATPENVQEYIHRIQAISTDGGTNLFAGLSKAYEGLEDDRTTGIVVVTDGVVNTGPTHQRDFLDLVKQHDLRLFTFIIGGSANTPLLEKIAKDSGGFAMTVSNTDDIAGRLLQAKTKVLHECMHNVQLTIKGERVFDVTPAKLGNIYVGEQVIVFGKYSGSGPATLELSARISGEEKTWRCDVDFPDLDTDNPEIERLWALARIEEIMEEICEQGEKESLRKEIVDTALQYSLVTDYTSMIVLSDEEMENLGIQRNNAHRVMRERGAFQKRASQPAKNYTVENQSAQNMFEALRSPGIGTGPVGPLGALGAAWFARRKHKKSR
jgi:Ca-activated chloride channel family protein